MYRNRAEDGSCNLAGKNIARLRKGLKGKPSQRKFAEMLQLAGLDVNKNEVQELEAGTRFISDIELKVLVKVLDTTYEELLK